MSVLKGEEKCLISSAMKSSPTHCFVS